MGFLSKSKQKQPQNVFCKKSVLRYFANLQENTCAKVSFLIKLQALGFIKKKTLAEVFSCECCEISKNTFFTEHFRDTAFEKKELGLLKTFLEKS